MNRLSHSSDSRGVTFELGTLVKLILILFTFFTTFYLSQFYTGGDQKVYTQVYDEIRKLPFLEAFAYYFFYINSLDIFHFLFIWFLGPLVTKNLLMAFTNSFLSFVIIKLLDSWKVSLVITSIILLTNFYLFVLYLAAERLKFGILFFLASILVLERRRISLFVIFLSGAFLSHFQVAFLYAGRVLEGSLERLKELFFRGNLTLGLIALLILSIIFISGNFFQFFIFKIEAYDGESSIMGFLRLTIFFILAFYYSRYQPQSLVFFAPLFFALFFIGQDRVNMIGYMFFLYYALKYNRGMNLGIAVTSVYFFYKTIDFIFKILTYGNGFYGSSQSNFPF